MHPLTPPKSATDRVTKIRVKIRHGTLTLRAFSLQTYACARVLIHLETHFKPTNSFQYLHFSSSHPKVAFNGKEAIGILRSYSSQAKFESTISTFRHHLLRRGYSKSFVDPLLATLPYSLRNQYIQLPHSNPDAHPNLNPLPNSNPIPNPNSNPLPNSITPRFITTYSPSLQHLHKILCLHWDLISQDSHSLPAMPCIVA